VSDDDLSLPYDRPAEQAALGGMLLSKDAIEDVAEIITGSADFYVGAHQIIYETIMALRDRSAPADAIAVADELQVSGQLAKVGGGPYLHTLIAMVPTPANAGYYARIVRERSVEREMIAAGSRIIQAAESHGLDLPDKVEAAYRFLDEASGRVTPPQARLMAELLPPALDRIERGGDQRGVPTGWTDLDELIGGWKPGLVVIGSRPAVGKSVVLLNTAATAAITYGVPALVCSLEMSERECTERILSAAALVDHGRIRDGDTALDERDWDRLNAVTSVVLDAPLRINDDPYLRVQGIRSDLRAMRRAGTPAGLVAIDYVQLMTAGGRPESRQAEVSEISRGLKLLSKEYDVPVVVGAQLNRGPEMRSDHRPLLADLRDSGSLEQDADLVILLYREGIYDPSSSRAEEIDYIVAKNRHGRTGTVTCAFRGRFMSAADSAWTPTAAISRLADEPPPPRDEPLRESA
jgi:replicative DNA helicase